MTEEEIRQILSDMNEGVAFSLDPADREKITAIYVKDPDPPNALADAIAGNVTTRPVKLFIDEQEFIVMSRMTWIAEFNGE